MNYFAHAHRILLAGDADPYFLAGLAVPDWLNVVARRTKCRTKHVEPYLGAPDVRASALAGGIAQHHHDDLWFHSTKVFTQLSLEFARRLKQTLADQSDLRAGFLGHILVELLLDAELVSNNRSLLDDYYVKIDQVEAEWLSAQVEQMAGKPVGRLAELIPRFVDERFLYDYGEDLPLCYRLNQVLNRVGLPQLPGQFVQVLPSMREEVHRHQNRLLSEPADAMRLK